jgi:hypothetical protein
MSKPKPEPVDPARVAQLARAVIAEDRFPYLATIDGDCPRVRFMREWALEYHEVDLADAGGD